MSPTHKNPKPKYRHERFEFNHSDYSELMTYTADLLNAQNEFGWALSDLEVFQISKDFTEDEKQMIKKTYSEVLKNMEDITNFLKYCLKEE